VDANQKAALAESAECLIADADAPLLFRQLMGVLDLAQKHVPVRLVGRAAVLNPLLVLWLDDEPAALRVVDLINRKRSQEGHDPLGDQNIHRRSYMRELMAQKRERARRLIELVNELRSEKDKLRGAARIEFERTHSNRWFDVKKERENDLREKLDRRLTADEMQEIKDALWADVDRELDDLEVFVRQEVRKPLHERAPGGYMFRLMPRKKGK
jgi:hypothetical protein